MNKRNLIKPSIDLEMDDGMGYTLENKIDTQELRRTLGTFTTGVTVITTVDANGKAYGLTANSFSSVSLDPPLILWSQSLSAPSYPIFRDSLRFAVNILAEDQVNISQCFARGGPDKFSEIDIRMSENGIPLLEGCCAYIECTNHSRVPGGDHSIFLGKVDRIQRTEKAPLVFGGGQYLTALPHPVSMTAVDCEAIGNTNVLAMKLAIPIVAELSKKLDQTLALTVWGNHGPTVVHWEPSTRPVSTNLCTGLVLPTLSSASGRAFLAYLPPSVVSDILEREEPNALSHTMDSILGEIRERGLARVVAVDTFMSMYRSNVSAIAAPVFNSDGTIICTLTVVGQADSLDSDWDATVAQTIKQAAQALSERLGYAR